MCWESFFIGASIGAILEWFVCWIVWGRQNTKVDTPSASTNSDYAAALKVYREYRSDDKNYSTGGFVEFCEKRLHSEEPNVA